MAYRSPGSAEPRWATPLTPERHTPALEEKNLGPKVADVAVRLGTELMPWQRLVSSVGGEMRYNDDLGMWVPHYRTVVFTVPRQNGKTTVILAWEVHRGTAWWRPQKIIYSAQTGADAAKKLVEDQAPILERYGQPRRDLGVRRIYKANGKEAVSFVNGHLGLLAGLEKSGHGQTVDLGVQDELFADTDYRRDQSLIPAMNTRADAQMLTASTMGTPASIPWNALVAQGRSLAERQKRDPSERHTLAYFEWSAPEDADPDDPAVWWDCMPALGITITEEVVRAARMKLPDGEFRRAYLNITTSTDDRVIPLASWQLVNSSSAKPEGALIFGLDVTPDRSSAAIVTCSDDKVIEVIEHKPGTGWVIERACELSEKHQSYTWAVPKGPATSLVSKLEKRDLDVREVAGESLAAACGQFYDDVVDRRLKVRRHDSMDAAVASAEKRNAGGEAFVWDRRGDADISPLMAATVAAWIADNDEDYEDFAFSS